MGLNTIMNAGMSGLQTAQTQLRVVSDNVANVNTAGYIRKVADQVPTTSQGIGTGVDIASVKLATDRYLQQASLDAGAAQGAAGAVSELYGRVQGLFGDPGGSTGLFSDINQLFQSLAASAETPTSMPVRQQVVTDAQGAFDSAAQIARGIQDVRGDADSRVASAVSDVNALLGQIESLNGEISRTKISGGDATGALTQQSQLVDQLSKLMDVHVSARAIGGVNVRTGDGLLLAGDGAASLSYDRAGSATPATQYNEIWVTPPGGQRVALQDHLASGQLKGLLQLRDVEAPQAAERLSEMTSQLADQLNAAHNASSAVPPPRTLQGKSTGLDLPSAIGGFTGKTTIAIVDGSGLINKRVAIDFDARTLSVDGAAATGFTPSAFLSALNGALGASASASFSPAGALSISASASANGVAVADDPTTPSSNAGRGFSWFFGLNDLVTSSQITTYQTGLRGSDPNGFTPGQTITLRLTDPAGSRLSDVQVAVPAGGAGTMDELVAALNAPVGGVGKYGQFALDASGQLTFSASQSPAPVLSVVDDRTSRMGPSGPSLSEMFGIGAGVRASRATSFSIRADINQNPGRLATAQLDLTASGSTPALVGGDGRGARRLADANQKAVNFLPAGASPGGAMTLDRYLSDMAGDIGGKAKAAENRARGSEALLSAAASARSAQEGVNLDEELVKLTTYQQAYNASARLITAAKDMYDTLIRMTG